MRRLILLVGAGAIVWAQAASAADMPTKAPVSKAVEPISYNWTGLYLGGHGGYGWGSSQSTATSGNAAFPAGTVFNRNNPTGGLGGGQIGYNFQTGSWVFGIEGDYSFADISGNESTSSVTVAGDTETSNGKFDWLATATGRVGYAWANWLYYVKGGGAWAGFKASSTSFNGAGAVTGTSSGSETRDGWTIGTGLEYGFGNNWSARVEYDYLDFGTAGVTRLTNLGVVRTRDSEAHVSLVKFALNYRFNWLGR